MGGEGGNGDAGGRRRNEGAIKLLDGWMADESGYDEETLPGLMEALDRNRREAGQSRMLFPEEPGGGDADDRGRGR